MWLSMLHIFIKDASVQVTALIVLGCVLAFEPVLPETREAMLKLQMMKDQSDRGDKEELNPDNFDYAEFSDSDTETSEDTSIPWLLKRCLINLGVDIESEDVSILFSVASAISKDVVLEFFVFIYSYLRNKWQKLYCQLQHL